MDHLPPIPDEYLKAIGSVAVHWNYLEQVMNLIMIHLLGKKITDDRSHIIFAHMTFPQKLDILSALVEKVEAQPEFARFQEYKSKVQPLLKAAQSGRNAMIHSMWGVNDGKLMRASISARGSLKLVWRSVDLKEIVDAQESIAVSYRALSELVFPATDNATPQSGQ